MAVIAVVPALYAPPVLSVVSLESLGINIALDGVLMSDFASATYPTGNKAYYVPFMLYEPYIVAQLFVANGATASGNVDVGIYDAAGTRIVSSGSTAQSGTTALQLFNITDTLIGPGQFYFAVAMDNTTGTLYRSLVASSTTEMRHMGILQQTSAFALPATATFAALSNNYLPLIGMTNRTVL